MQKLVALTIFVVFLLIVFFAFTFLGFWNVDMSKIHQDMGKSYFIETELAELSLSLYLFIFNR